MSGRIFQNVVLQFKETTDRTIGVIDADGTVIACSELTGIGKKWTKYVESIAAAEGACITLEGRTFKALPSWGTHFDYAVHRSERLLRHQTVPGSGGQIKSQLP